MVERAFCEGQIITFRPAPHSRAVSGPIDRVHVDERGRVQYHVRIQHAERYTSGYWVWHGEARRAGIQRPLFALEDEEGKKS